MKDKPTYEDLEKQLEELKQNCEEKFNQLIKNSFDILVLLDSDGNQHYVSESCEKILGYKPEELINIPVIEKMLHPEDQEQVVRGFTEIVTGVSHGGTQYRHRHKNGGWIYLEAFGTNQLENPLIKSVVINVRDITERKKIEKELIESKTRLSEANATKDRFFSIIGHDLKSPFNSIVGFSDILLEQVQNKDYDGIDNYARIIYDSSNRAMNLLTNLLEWSQTQTGRMEFNPELFDLKSTIKEIVELYRDSTKQKRIAISIRLPHDIQVFADKSIVKTILRNLISNAIKFSNTGGEIIIGAEQKKDELIVYVSDNGIGIKAENIEKLFSINHSESTLGTEKEKGTGLGLLLCKELIEMHGGKIWVESKKDTGSIFKFSLPVQ